MNQHGSSQLVFTSRFFWLLASARLPFLADLTSEFQVEDPYFDNARKSSIRCRWYLYNRTATGHSEHRLGRGMPLGIRWLLQRGSWQIAVRRHKQQCRLQRWFSIFVLVILVLKLVKLWICFVSLQTGVRVSWVQTLSVAAASKPGCLTAFAAMVNRWI